MIGNKIKICDNLESYRKDHQDLADEVLILRALKVYCVEARESQSGAHFRKMQRHYLKGNTVKIYRRNIHDDSKVGRKAGEGEDRDP